MSKRQYNLVAAMVRKVSVYRTILFAFDYERKKITKGLCRLDSVLPIEYIKYDIINYRNGLVIQINNDEVIIMLQYEFEHILF